MLAIAITSTEVVQTDVQQDSKENFAIKVGIFEITYDICTVWLLLTCTFKATYNYLITQTHNIMKTNKLIMKGYQV